MIKLLALDIDDTLVNSSFDISAANRAAIADAMRAGVKIVLATGRGFLGSKSIRDELRILAPTIVYGGALVADAITGEILHAEYLDDAEVRACISAADRLGLHAQIYDGDTVIFRSDNAFTKQYTTHLRLPFRVDPDMMEKTFYNVPKVLLYADPMHVDAYLVALERDLPPDLHVLRSKPGFLEIGRRTCTKGTALQFVASYFGLERDDVAAIGDNTLDMDMIQWAGVGCCVANGNEAVKAVSDIVLPSCEEDGVACFIKTYILDC